MLPFFRVLSFIIGFRGGVTQDLETLRGAAEKRGILVGTAVNNNYLGSNKYAHVAASEYNVVVAENSCKWASIQPDEGKFNFKHCDEILNFTRTSMKGLFRGHNLCWGNWNPPWLLNLTADAKRRALQHHISTVGQYYLESAYAWDVVNEAITDSGNAIDVLKPSVWYPDVPDFIELAFTTARSAFGSKVKLFYNDYNHASAAGRTKVKSDRVFTLVERMVHQGVPIDGVGFQMHIDEHFDSFHGVRENFERFGKLGLEVHITELDISFASWDLAQEAKQAAMFAAILKVCVEVPACTAFLTWGFTDRYTWRGSETHPLPFDGSYHPKTAVQAMIEVLDNSTLIPDTVVFV